MGVNDQQVNQAKKMISTNLDINLNIYIWKIIFWHHERFLILDGDQHQQKRGREKGRLDESMTPDVFTDIDRWVMQPLPWFRFVRQDLLDLNTGLNTHNCQAEIRISPSINQSNFCIFKILGKRDQLCIYT